MFFTRHRLLVFLKGMAMGAADAVPGVSGGTVALITNIYEELVDSIRNVGWHVLVIWRQQGFRQAWRYLNGDFLLTLVTGILCSLLLLGRLVLSLMENYLPYLLAFFAGLVLASIRFVAGNVSRWQVLTVCMFLAGAAAAILLTYLPLGNASDNLAAYFFYGAFAICAMILPGISGAFILVLLGAYAPVLAALTNFDWPVILVFAAGCLSGLMAFSRFLSWLLHHHHESTMALLTGMLAGSLAMLWPWQLPNVYLFAGHEITLYQPAMPGTYLAETGVAVSVTYCLSLLVAGLVLVLLLEYAAGNLGSRKTDGGA